MTNDGDVRREMVALNADVVGYSRLIADDYDATTEAMAQYHALVERMVGAEGGSVANFVGDSFMAVFEDAARAIRAAIGITRAIEDRNTDIAATARVYFRMGLDMGDVGASGGDYHGDALNIAARIQAIARPGGISVSGRVYRALDEPELRFRPVGRHKLKNIPEQVDVYDFTDLPTGGSVAAGPGLLSLESPTIAVVPTYVDADAGPLGTAAAVIRHELIHRLAGVPLLNVVDAPADPEGQHRAGQARYLLETGVHQIGDQVRVFASVLDVTTMNFVKSHRWTVAGDDVLALADRIAEEVVRSIEVELVVGAPAGLYADMGDPEAVGKVNLGWYHLRSGTREGWARASELFGEVAQNHPERPYGLVLSAYALWIGASNQWVPDTESAFAKATELARKGAEVGDPTGMSKAVQAAVFLSQGNVSEAVATLSNLETVRPTCDVTFALGGSIRRYLGEWEKAVEMLDVAMRLTGINKPWYPTVKAVSLFIGGRVDEAAAIAEGVLEHQPDNLEALLLLAASQKEQGLERRAQATAQLIRDRFPAVDADAWLDRHPYQRREIVDRWKGDLAALGAITGA